MGSPQQSILLVENDEITARGLIWALEQENYKVTHALTVKDASENLETESYCLALLEMQLPDGSGCQIQDVLNDKNIPVIYLTTIDDKLSVVRALESGAADYVTKPFDVRELFARIKKALMLDDFKSDRTKGTHCQRSRMLNAGSIGINDLEVNTVSGKVLLRGKQLNLTALEYRLLVYLIMNRGRLLARPQIIDNVWEGSEGYVEDNTLSTYIKSLRRITDGEIDIETVRGMGYRVN